MSGWCGCCGRGVRGHDNDPDPPWCRRCTFHTAATGRLEDRTFFALNGEDCPYQVAPTQEADG